MKRLMVDVVCLALLFLCVGCSESPTPETVLFTVNDVAVTEEGVNREVNLRFELFQNQRPLKSEAIEKARNGLRTSLLKTKVSEMLLLQAAAGTDVLKEKFDSTRIRYFNTFRGKCSDVNQFEDLLRTKGVYDQYEDKISAETLINVYLEKKYRDKLLIADEVVSSTIKDMIRGNEIAEATNRVIYATATNVWKQAAAGADFVSLARKYSNALEQEEDGDLGDRCDYNDFKGEEIEIWNAVSALKSGEVTPPLSTSEGLSIYKCYERANDDGYAGGVRYHLGRILFCRALLYDNFDAKYVRRELEREAYNKVVQSELAPRLKSASVVFPNGEQGLPPGFVKYTEKMIGKDGK